MASFYVVVYLGTALPVIGVGVLTISAGLLTAIQIFSYIVMAICLAALITELRAARHVRDAGSMAR